MSELGRLHGWVSEALVVPPEPDPPAGEPGSLQVFRAAPAFYRYLLVGWALKQLSGAFGLGFAYLTLDYMPAFPGRDVYHAVELAAVAIYLLQLPITFLLLRLDWAFRWYMVTDRSLRIREGLWRVREQTLSFANIQNMAVRQGPLQRLLGIANLEVRTAGGADAAPESGAATQVHTGYFRGVADATGIRDLILEQLRRRRDAGLGDPDPDHAGEAEDGAGDDDLLAAAGELRAAARALATSARRGHL